LDFAGTGVTSAYGISTLRVERAAAITRTTQILKRHHTDVGTVGTLRRWWRDSGRARVSIFIDAFNRNLWEKRIMSE
jgi:hypothetical protein